MELEKETTPAFDASSLNSGDLTPVNDSATPALSREHTPTDLPDSKNEQPDLESGNADTPKTATDWTGPDDPENPHNWPLPKKLYHLFVTAVLSFAVTYGSSAYSPGISQVAQDFHISEEAAILGLSLYVLGLGLGPMVSAGLSETYGRRIVYIGCTPFSLLFTLGAGLSKNLTTLLVCRFLAGAVGAGPLAVGAGTNADLWLPKDRAAYTSVWILMPFLGPALGPSTASYPTQNSSWRWGQWLLLIVGGTSYLLSLFQSETYKKAILLSRAKKYNLPPPADPLPSGFARVVAILNVTCVRSTKMLFTEPICTAFSIYSAFTFGVLFAFFPAVTYVVRSQYDFSVGEAGLVFLAIGTGCVIATPMFILIDRFTYRRKLLERMSKGDNRPLPPEERLYAAMLGSVLLPISLFWFGWTANRHTHWIVPIVSLGFFGAGNLLVFVTTATYLVDVYGPMGGASAMSANSLARYGLGAAFPLFSVQMYKALGIDWASGLLGFVTVAMLPIPWLFYRYGKGIRSRGSVPKSDA
jgi:MFS family permease